MSSFNGLLRCLRPVLKHGLISNRFCRMTWAQPLKARHFSVSTCRSAEYYYAESHEYVAVEGDVGTVGISGHAQGTLGEIVYIQLPENGSSLEKGDDCGAVESVKAASELYSPVSGTVDAVNTDVENEPTLINDSWDDKGWLFKIKLSNPEELKELMNEKAYTEFIESDEH